MMEGQDANVVSVYQVGRPLPPEIWNLILQNVDEPKDVYSCSQVVPAWKKFLENKLPTTLFHLTLPNLLAYFTKSDLLACSQVSHDWKDVIDLAVNKRVEKDIIENSSSPQPNFRTTFSNLETITKFFDNFVPSAAGNKPVMLLPYRDIAFEYQATSMAPDYEQYMQKSFLFYINYGALVKHLSMSFEYPWTCFYQSVANAYTALLFTPNLCTLQISFYKPHQLGELDRNEFESFFKKKNLPDLSSLKSLKLKPCPVPIARIFLQGYRSKISQFEMIDVDDFCFKVDVSKSNENLLQGQTVCTHVCSLENVESLEQMLSSHPQNLDFLTVDICHLDIIGERLAQVMNGHHNYFKNLMLHKYLHSQKIEQLKNLEKLRLPNLETLSLVGFGLPSLEFLMKVAPALAHLTLDVSEADDLEYGWLYNSLYANHQFWVAMPNIQYIRVSLSLAVGGDLDKHRQPTTVVYLRSVYNILYRHHE